MFRFEKLKVWQRAIAFADRVNEITRAFPSDERFGFTSQMSRAAVSISSNIAEGSGRSSEKDFAHFVEIAYASLMEFVSQGRIAARQSFLAQESHDELYNYAEELARMLSGLRNSLLRPSSSSGS